MCASDTFCKVQALLGIYWPVASFLWTDCIAYFVFHMARGAARWKSFRWFHAICWGVPAIMVFVVQQYDFEGRVTGAGSNSGQSDT